MPGVSRSSEPSRQAEDFAVGRGMATLVVCVANVLRGQQLLPRQRIHQRRLADPRRAHEYHRAAGGQPPAQAIQPSTRHTAHHLDRSAGDDIANRIDGGVDVVAKIRFRQHHQRHGATVPRRHQVALDTPRIELLVQRADDAGDVDVGGDHLLLALGPGLSANELGAAREDLLDGGGSVRGRLNQHPVADRGQLTASGGAVQHSPRRHAGSFPPGRDQSILAAVLGHDTRRHLPRLDGRTELFVALRSPPPVAQAFGDQSL